MYRELHEFYRNFIIENSYKELKFQDGSNADFGGMLYAYIGNNIYLYDINSIDNNLHYVVSERILNEDRETIEHNDLFTFDTETMHISLLIDFINNIKIN